MESTQPTLKPLHAILRLSLAFACLKVLIQVLGNILAQHAGYGIFRDELYYLVCGRHLAFGYVDQPPLVALQARISETLFGHEHLWSLRLLSALAGGAKVFLTGILAWALGGGRRAAALAMLGVLVAGVYLGIDGILSMNSFDPVFWMLCALALIRIVQSQSSAQVRNWWIVFGVSAGLAFQNKDSVAFYLIAMLVAILFTPTRRILASRWFAVSVLLIVAIAMPNFLWQVAHHFPTLEWLHNVQVSGKNVDLPPLAFIKAQLIMLNPLTALLWISGVAWLLFGRQAGQFRFLGVFYLVFLPFMILLHAKDYYLAPAYPVFFAAGAVAWLSWAAARANSRLRLGAIAAYAVLLITGFFVFVPFSIPVLPPQQFLAYERVVHFAPGDTENHAASPLPQFYADMFGWQQMADEIARVYNSLPAADKARAGIFCNNYGEAGAVDILGAKHHLPQAISGHQNFYFWGPRGYTGDVLLVVQRSRSDLDQKFASVTDMAHVENPYAMPYEHVHIYLCRGLRKPLATVWPAVKNWY
ncbi:MAG: phospholipid carrier-dependent glycosyltransferase [Acidobacteria bacterium]|nr:phospholipid carrier-dependent glycosyltransferase [Acidobacteriota bacterium]MBW4044054.1 phospholipid carrier-dependent glycosyltransferase [Acidobacteriota bacterium]